MNKFNEEEMLKAINNCNDENILNLNKDLISKQKNDILQKLQISGSAVKDLFKKLKQYRYINNLNDLKLGNYIRWINLKKTNDIKLTNGGIIVKIFDDENDDSPYLLCRNSRNNIFKLNLSHNLIFQKLNHQEDIIISLLSFLNKN